MLLGVKTDTRIRKGKLSKSQIGLSLKKKYGVLGRLVGKIKQVPPAYSAVKHCGKPLYKYARGGEFPEIAREVTIFSLN